MMDIRVISEKISQEELVRWANQSHGEMVKAVVDLRSGLLAVGGELHADAEALLLDQGSQQGDLWGINLYPHKSPAARIEYTSLINIRPRHGNRSMNVENPDVRRRIEEVVDQRVDWGA